MKQKINTKSKITFEIGEKGIFTINPDGSDLKRIIVSGYGPEWSPDGKWIVFTDNDNLYIMQQDGNDIRQITHYKDYAAWHATWSPDSKKITYNITKRELSLEHSDFLSWIYIVDIETLQQKQITNEGIDVYPIWISSDKILFYKEDHKSPQKLFVMDIEGGNQIKCNIIKDSDLNPRLSRDGSKIVFIRDKKICLMNIDGRNLQAIDVGSGVYHISRVCLSPDCQKIAYSYSDLNEYDSRFRKIKDGYGIKYEIYVIDINGKNKQRLITQEDHIHDICWSPWLYTNCD